MAKGYIKIWCRTGELEDAREELLKIKEVKSAELTAGEQDVIALVEATSYEEILNLVVKKIRNTKGVRNTITNLIL
jgi:DNA-binding Lrp family transcriptional regulator